MLGRAGEHVLRPRLVDGDLATLNQSAKDEKQQPLFRPRAVRRDFSRNVQRTDTVRVDGHRAEGRVPS